VHPEFRGDIQTAIPGIVECLKNFHVCKAAINGLSSLGAHQLHGEIQTAIPGIVECPKHSSPGVRDAAIDVLLTLGAYPDFHKNIQLAILTLLGSLRDSGSCQNAFNALASLVVHADFHKAKETLIFFFCWHG